MKPADRPFRERAARSLCEMQGHLPDELKDGRPRWESFLPDVDAVWRATPGGGSEMGGDR